MVRQLVGAVGAIAILGVGVTSAAPSPACSANLTCRCAVQAGATYDAFSRKWRVEETQWTLWENCISRGLQAGNSPAQPKARPRRSN
jgi:hypothetical protein